MRGVAEDVYYVPRDASGAIGLNQLLQVPAQLSEIELEAIDEMAGRSHNTMGCRTTADTMGPLRLHGSIESLAHGLYYVGPNGGVYVISQDRTRPDLTGPAMDFARATVEAGRSNLRRLRTELNRLR
jgi:hypothetical protein